MTLSDLRAARELADAATPGPWRFDQDDDTIEDAKFIAAARTLVPDLLDEVERLRGLLGEACDIAERLAGLECDSESEDRARAIRESGLG